MGALVKRGAPAPGDKALRAGGGGGTHKNHPQGGPLAGPVGPEQAKKKTRRHLQIQAIDGHSLGKFIGNGVEFNDPGVEIMDRLLPHF